MKKPYHLAAVAGLVTLGLGLASCLTAYVAGPLLVAGSSGVLGAALGLMRLAQGVESSAAVLRS